MEYRNTISEANPEKILIFRALQLGDLLCAVPAFRALRTALPEASISLLGLPWAQDFVSRFNSYLDEFIVFPGYPGLSEQPANVDRFPGFLSSMQERAFDLAVQMHGSGQISNPITVLLGARRTAGYFIPGDYCPNPILFMPYPDDVQEVRRHLRLMEFLGFHPQGENLEFPLLAKDWEELDRLQEQFDIRENYVCVHPGARFQKRRWPAERFAAVAQGMIDQGLQVVLTGSEEEVELTRCVEMNMRKPVINLAGRTSLGAVAALISRARLTLSNDTGISHLAAAVKAPSVILFSTSDSRRWAPINRDLHVPIEDALQAEPSDVLSRAVRHLQESHAQPSP